MYFWAFLNQVINKIMQIIPSVSILDGKVVRTLRGDIAQVKTYEQNPLDLAMEFEANGIKRLHLIDLNGAKQRKVVNYQVLETIASYTKLEIDFSGGVTTDGDVRTVFEFGAKYVTAASVAVHEREKFGAWLVTYGGERIILAADARDGIVLTRGWKRQTGISLEEHIAYYYERGIRYLKSTEIDRDGSLQGPAIEMYQNIREQFPDLKILASGGVRSVDDLKALQDIGVHGVIFGKSFYEGRIKLKELSPFLT